MNATGSHMHTCTLQAEVLVGLRKAIDLQKGREWGFREMEGLGWTAMQL